MTGPEHHPGANAIREEIAREIARVHLDSYGEAAFNLDVGLQGDFITVLMDVVLSRAEEMLVGGGKAEAVTYARESYQQVIESTFVAIIERATGRRVVGFASRTVVDGTSPWSAEVFRLAPAAAP